MYSHYEMKYHCDSCEFHCHFASELKKHKITHHTNPSFQCMHKNCSRWFMRKADLVVHVETHKKNKFQCSKCDFDTNLPKYLKEHMKSHSTELPYECKICGMCFMWRSSVRRHKEKNIQLQRMSKEVYAFFFSYFLIYLAYTDCMQYVYMYIVALNIVDDYLL